MQGKCQPALTLHIGFVLVFIILKRKTMKQQSSIWESRDKNENLNN